MAKLASNLLSQVKTSSLARVTKATSIAEAIATVALRVRSLTLITSQNVIDRLAVAGVVLSGLSQANTLTGADGSGKPHVSVRTNFALCTVQEIEAFVASLSTIPTIDGVQQAYYDFIDTYVINGVIWEGESCWENRKSYQGTFSGFLRADGTTGDISISGIVAEKPGLVLQAKKLPSLNASIPVAPVASVPPPPQAGAVPPPPPPNGPVMKQYNGAVYSSTDLISTYMSSGYTADQAKSAVDALPNA